MSQHRPIATLAALLTFGALCAPPASGEPRSGQPTDPVSQQLAGSPEEFWTNERIAAAAPLDMTAHGPADPLPESADSSGPGTVYAEPAEPAHPVARQPQAEEASTSD